MPDVMFMAVFLSSLNLSRLLKLFATFCASSFADPAILVSGEFKDSSRLLQNCQETHGPPEHQRGID